MGRLGLFQVRNKDELRVVLETERNQEISKDGPGGTGG